MKARLWTFIVVAAIGAGIILCLPTPTRGQVSPPPTINPWLQDPMQPSRMRALAVFGLLGLGNNIEIPVPPNKVFVLTAITSRVDTPISVTIKSGTAPIGLLQVSPGDPHHSFGAGLLFQRNANGFADIVIDITSTPGPDPIDFAFLGHTTDDY